MHGSPQVEANGPPPVTQAPPHLQVPVAAQQLQERRMRNAAHGQVAGSSVLGDGKGALQLPQASAGQHGSIHHIAGEGAGGAP